MGWSKSTHSATTEEGDANVGSTSCQSSSYSPTYGPQTSPVSPPPSPELARVLDMAEAIRTYYDEDDDDITASFEEMESDDAVEERTSLVEPVEWASDGDDSVEERTSLVEPVEWASDGDDTVEERTSLVEPVKWASDGDDSVEERMSLVNQWSGRVMGTTTWRRGRR